MRMTIEEKIRKVTEGNCDYLGFADLTPARDLIHWQSGIEADSYPYGISIGVALVDDIVDLVPQRDERWAATLYRTHGYEAVNARLDQMASMVGSELQRAGYRAMPIPASRRVSDEKLCGPISHKMVAHLAGLGWIGKSCLLVTPDHGPRVRWISVLTDAPLKPLGKPMDQRCGDCRECVKACPVSAFTGRNFIESEPREARYDARNARAIPMNWKRRAGTGCADCASTPVPTENGRSDQATSSRRFWNRIFSPGMLVGYSPDRQARQRSFSSSSSALTSPFSEV
ncbi:MAG: Epoxyqueuosine reductase [Methanomassiliicoccales archaeon PtaU1.Bin124]|nr:MAG: Epoxyqueuosine reductase [Methanomassiliicoccales archaeon PtaU1.Bin124]